MKITKKRELSLTCERKIIIKTGNPKMLQFCPVCQSQSFFITIDEAAIFRRMTAREIFRLVETGQIHSQETAEGLLFVCLISLAPATKSVFKLTE